MKYAWQAIVTLLCFTLFHACSLHAKPVRLRLADVKRTPTRRPLSSIREVAQKSGEAYLLNDFYLNHRTLNSSFKALVPYKEEHFQYPFFSGPPVIIEADSKEELEKAIDTIIEFTKSRGELPPSEPLKFSTSAEEISVDVSALFTEFIRKLNGNYHRFNGPNCLNCVLVEAGAYPNIENTTSLEGNSVLNTHFDPVLDRAHIPTGSVVTIRQRYEKARHKEIHALTYIDEYLGFSKGSLDRSSPYGLVSLIDEYSLNGIDLKTLPEECINPPLYNIPEHCNMFISIYKIKRDHRRIE